MEKTVVLPEMYLPFSQYSQGEIKLHEFQVRIKEILNIKEDSLIIHAPTGAGKTFAFLLPLTMDFRDKFVDPKILIIAPTNALVYEIYESISKEKYKLNLSGDTHADIWTAKDLGNWWMRMEDVAKSLDSNDIIVSNPDIISLIVSGYYAHADDNRMKQWSRIFRKIHLLIIDEYDSYPEEEMAKLLSFIVLARSSGNTGIKYLFASATPSKKFEQMLNQFAISFTRYDEHPVMSMPLSGGRKFRGKLSVTFTDKSLMSSAEEELHADRKWRTLFLADHVTDAEMIIDKIMRYSPSDPILEITGINTRSPDKKEPSGEERFIVATNAAERGLNMRVQIAHIEPGMYFENFRQRFGRVARGEEGKLYVHVDQEIVRQMPDEISSDEELFLKLETLKPSRDVYITKVKRVSSAFMYLVYKSSAGPLKEQVRNYLMHDKYFKWFDEFDRLIEEFSQHGKEVFDNEDIECLNKWWLDYLRAYGFFRGKSINVKVILPRIDNKRSVMDIVWLKKKTEYDPPDPNSENIYRIKCYSISPKKVSLRFKLCKEFNISETDLRDAKVLISKWQHEFEEFFDDHRIRVEMSGNTKLKDVIKRIEELLPRILEPMYPSLLPPTEVEVVDNDLFI